MPRIGVRPLPVAVLALTVAMAVASVLVSVGHETLYDTVLYPLNAVALGAAGALVVLFQRENPVGWVLAAMGVQGGWAELTEGYAYHATWPGASVSEWLTNWAPFLGIGGTAVVLTLFPTGRDLGRFRRAAVAVGVLAIVLMTISAAFGNSTGPVYVDRPNPLAVSWMEPLGLVGQVALVVALLSAIGSLIVRFRRAEGVERQQLKWLAYAVSLLAAAGPVAVFRYNDSASVRLVIACVVPLIPVAICIAILRYRLYDIDLIITRTLVYVALTVLLAGAYVGTVFVLGAVVGRRHSTWATVGATLAVALAFRPLRTRVQDLVDRRFRRARYDALARVDTFLDDLRVGRAAPEELESLLRDILGRPALELRYLVPGASPPTGPSPDEGVAELVVERDGVPLAVVRHPVAADDADRRLEEVLARAGLALEIARLRAEVRAQLTEVEASRARIVAAGYEERRRLERDLHDGAQQRLVSVGLALRNAQFELGDHPVGPALDDAVAQLAGAIAELRELAGGVRPAGLDAGLEGALRELAGRTPLPVEVRAAPERYPTDIEATAYFVACEALANAVKHARATGVALHAERVGRHLVLTVRDDGAGGARLTGGTGLRGLADRVAAQGGLFHVESPPGAGTTVVAELPCAS